ncbi:uncharacterized protein LOC117606334 isoform X5 [Osmia lignaria lignaria]|uniref:uncharacterized protein LOC117606334 isoform X5 n=1 Tax=Osmia lignaria lignaria TaxID=1437193 RepID=UPI00402B5BFF
MSGKMDGSSDAVFFFEDGDAGGKRNSHGTTEDGRYEDSNGPPGRRALSEESRMLRCDTVDYVEVTKVDNICEDIENNNTDDKGNIFDDRNIVTRFSSNSKGVFAQCLVSGAVLLLAAGGGMPIGYSAILLPQLAQNNGTMHADRELGSWIASVHSLATPVGSLMSGPLLDGIGRRGSLRLTAVPLCTGWIIMGFAQNIPTLLIGRVVSGLAVGLMAVPAQVLLGEMADPGLRGFLTGSTLAFYCLGIVIIYALGATLAWNMVAFCGTILPILALSALLLIPESPTWLVRQKKPEEARKALLWLRGGNAKQIYVIGICLLLYVGVNTLGLMTLPALMVAELLPQRARGIGGGCNFFFFNLFIFIVTKVFPMVCETVGIAGIFIIFGISAILEGAFIYVALPETNNRTLEEIEDYFQQSNLLWVTRSTERRKDAAFIMNNFSTQRMQNCT